MMCMTRLRRLTIAFCACLGAACLLVADEPATRDQGHALHLLPAPQEIEVVSGAKPFALGRDVPVALCDEATEGDELTARDLRDGIQAVTGAALQLEFGVPAGRAIVLGIPKRDAELAELCKKSGIEIDPRIGDQGYLLHVTPDRIVLAANASVGLFYAVQTLRQLVDPATKTVPCVKIRDWPDLPQRWVMYDVARFQTIDVKYCKRIIEALARAKINGLVFYMEDDYNFSAYPFLGREGTFSRTKVARLVAFAKKLHVQLIPHFQSLGHMYGVLRHEELADLRCNKSGTVVCPFASRKMAFFDSVYRELSGAFSNTPFLHVGGDEFEGGFARCQRCRTEVKLTGRAGVYARHMTDLHQLASKHGRTMVLWTSHHEGGARDYFDPARTRQRSLTLQAADKMPKDVVLFEWDYAARDDYPTVQFYQDAGFEKIIVCPEVKGWLRLYPHILAGFGNCKQLLQYARDHKLLGACICTWSLYRGALFETSWPVLLYGAQCAWCNEKADPKEFARTFAARWFGIRGDALKDMETVFYFPHLVPPERRYWRVGWTAPEIFFMDPRKVRRHLKMFVEGDVQRQSAELLVVTEDALAAVDRLKRRARRNLLTMDFMEFAILNYQHVARKCLILEEAARSYREAAAIPGRGALPHLGRALAAMEDLRGDYPYMVKMFRRAAEECGGRKEDVIPEAEQSDWAKRTNRTRRITPVVDLQRAAEEMVATLHAAGTNARAEQLLPAPEDLGFGELSEAKVGTWAGPDVNAPGPGDSRTLICEVTRHVDGPGLYEVVFDGYGGADLSIVSAALHVSSFKGELGLDRMSRIAEDSHSGLAGHKPSGNVYELRLYKYQYKKALRYFVVAEAYNARGGDTKGVVWFRKRAELKAPEKQGKGEGKEK